MIPRHPKFITASVLQQQLENEQHRVTKRTVERDLQALSAVFPLTVNENSRPFGWSWQANATHFSIPGLSNHEALTFVMVEEHLKMLLPASTLTQLQPYFESAKQHLNRTNASGQVRSWLNKVRTIPPTQPLQPASINADIQQTVYDALLADKQLDIQYLKRNATEPSSYRIHPLAVVQRGPVTYLTCKVDYDDNKTRKFAMHRIQAVTVLKESVEPPKDFSIDKVIAEGDYGFGNGKQIQLEAIFQNGTGEHLYETPLSIDQKLKDLGGGKLKLNATVADTQQLVWWLLALGNGVEVVKPEALRGKMAEITKSMAEVYQR